MGCLVVVVVLFKITFEMFLLNLTFFIFILHFWNVFYAVK